MRKTAVLNVVGLTAGMLGPRLPRLAGWAAGGATARIREVLPAVTCPAQTTYLTGLAPGRHGIVGNGWYFRDECEVRFWRQSSRLVKADRLWDHARRLDPAFTCANLFWWFNMYSGVDVAITPRPMYPADGRKIPDLYSAPGDIRFDVQRDLGPFPFFDFWGPRASVRSSEWIAQAARWVDKRFDPTLAFVYLPHLDYDLQRLGPSNPGVAAAQAAIDRLAGDLIGYYEASGTQVVVLSEYGMTDVNRPVHLNRRLREAGLLAVRDELGRELLDAGASRAFGVADHQVAHVYVNDTGVLPAVHRLLEATPGVAGVLDQTGLAAGGLGHERAGDLVAVAEADSWFTYYYWLDDGRAPDFARTVDIHRKPGYDPVELFIDPAIRLPALKVAAYLARQNLGFRALLDVVPLDAALVRGSHGRPSADPAGRPLLATRSLGGLPEEIAATDVFGLLWRHLTDERVPDLDRPA